MVEPVVKTETLTDSPAPLCSAFQLLRLAFAFVRLFFPSHLLTPCLRPFVCCARQRASARPVTSMAWLTGYGKHGSDENDNLGVDWVLQYEFGDIGRMTPCLGVSEY